MTNMVHEEVILLYLHLCIVFGTRSMMLLLHIFGKLEDNRNSFHKIAGMEDARERLEASAVSEGERQPNLITAISTVIRKPRKRATGNHVLNPDRISSLAA